MIGSHALNPLSGRLQPPPLAPLLLASLLGSAAAPGQPPMPQADSAHYGVSWKLIQNEAADYNLPCERTGDAIGLQAADFDHLFPWSHIRLCALQQRSHGAWQVIYADDPRFRLDGSSGHVMVEIPKHYMQRRVQDGREYRAISAGPRPGFIVDPAFVEPGRELEHIYIGAYEGVVNRTGQLTSASGFHPTADKTRAEFRQHAKANGPGYGLFDLRCLLLLQNLFLIEHAQRNSQETVGNGWGKILQPAKTHRCVLPETGVNRLVTRPPANRVDEAQARGLFIGCAILITSYERPGKVLHQDRTLTAISPHTPEPGLTSLAFDGPPIDTTTDMCLGGAAQKTGWSDTLETHTGHSDFQGQPPDETYRCAVKYRHIENLWGNLWCFLDGINLDQGRAFFCNDMSRYTSPSCKPPYQPCGIRQQLQDDNGDVGGPREIHYLKNLGFDPQYPWLALPQDFMFPGETAVTGASKILRHGHFADYYYLSDWGTGYVHGGGFDHYWRCGLFTLRGWCRESTRWYLYGSRLIFRPPD